MNKMNDLIQSKYEQLQRLCDKYNVRRLHLFGSATSDRFDSDLSDLDFLVQFQSMPPAEHADCYFGFLEALQDLFSRPIDLVEIEAVKNPVLLETIEETKSILYAA